MGQGFDDQKNDHRITINSLIFLYDFIIRRKRILRRFYCEKFRSHSKHRESHASHVIRCFLTNRRHSRTLFDKRQYFHEKCSKKRKYRKKNKKIGKLKEFFLKRFAVQVCRLNIVNIRRCGHSMLAKHTKV